MSLKLDVANFFAKYSVGMWNPNRVTRVICRKAYQILMTYTAGHSYPYADPEFAPWPEDDGVIASGEPTEGRGYTLITDQAGFVVRHCTSYCAWKIWRLTGKWLKRQDKRKRYDAKDWQELLAQNGYTKAVDISELESGHHYVGIADRVSPFWANDNGHGVVWWFFGREGEMVKSWTYLNGHLYRHELVGAEHGKDIVWVQID